MWTVIKDILSTDGGAAVSVGGTIFAILFLVYRSGKLTEKFSNQEKDLAEVKKHTNHIPEVKGNHRVLEGRFDKMECKIDKISEAIQLMNVSMTSLTKSDPLTQSNSPLSITNQGQELVMKFGLKAMVDDNWSNICKISSEIESQNPYDIQQFFIERSILHLEDLIGDSNFEKVKLIAYNEGLAIGSISKVIAVLIRDRYFKEHQIDVMEIDKYDPQNKE